MSRIAFAAVLGASAVASADFVNASFTQESLSAGEVTYRIFLNYDSPLDKQLAVSGNAAFSALSLNASSPLINKHLVPTVPADVPGALALPGDSWLTIGDEATQETSFSPDFLDSNEDANGAIVNGSSFTQADNGGYFDSNPSSAEDGGSILIAQFTFAAGSTWTYTGTSDYNAGGDTLTNVGFSVTNVPAPGALALLGLAGFGRRRRG